MTRNTRRHLLRKSIRIQNLESMNRSHLEFRADKSIQTIFLAAYSGPRGSPSDRPAHISPSLSDWNKQREAYSSPSDWAAHPTARPTPIAPLRRAPRHAAADIAARRLVLRLIAAYCGLLRPAYSGPRGSLSDRLGPHTGSRASARAPARDLAPREPRNHCYRQFLCR